MTEKKIDPVRAYLAGIGKRGGQVKVPKGFSALSEDERKANAQKAAAARWGGKKKQKRSRCNKPFIV